MLSGISWRALPHGSAGVLRCAASALGARGRLPQEKALPTVDCTGKGGKAEAPLAAAAAAAAAAFVFATDYRGSSPRCDEVSSNGNLTRWQSAWDNSRLGWHRADTNPVLQKYLEELVPSADSSAPGMGPRVLLPLCGKTLDMVFLARKGYRVVGVEGVGKAIDEFAQEHAVPIPGGGNSMVVNLPPPFDSEAHRARFCAKALLLRASDDEPVRTHIAPPVLLVQGDFLDIGPAEAQALVPFDAAFDRGSLVAIAPAERRRYARVLSDLIKPGGKVLVVACEHEPFKGGALGPPFQVTEADLRTLFEDDFDVKPLSREDTVDLLLGSPPTRIRERGVDHFYECVYLLTKKEVKSQ